MSVRAIWGSLVAVLISLLLLGVVVIYASNEDQKLRAENRDTLVRFVCVTIRESENVDIVREFAVILADLGETCER